MDVCANTSKWLAVCGCPHQLANLWLATACQVRANDLDGDCMANDTLDFDFWKLALSHRLVAEFGSTRLKTDPKSLAQGTELRPPELLGDMNLESAMMVVR